MSLQPYNSAWGAYISPMGIHFFDKEFNVMRNHWDQKEHYFPDDDYTPSVSPESVGRCWRCMATLAVLRAPPGFKL